jgi:large subunit ribosomal protein L23
MAIIDIFKKKEEGKEDNSSKSSKDIKTKKEKTGSINSVKNFVLESAYITEKATFLEKENKYIFKVLNNTNKIEVKKTIEREYKVNVLSVNIINVRRKKRRLGKHQGFKKGYKKAIVEIKEGQKINLV